MSADNAPKAPPETRPRRREFSTSGPWVPIILVLTLLYAIMDERNSKASERAAIRDANFSDSAFLGGVNRKYDASAFRHGEADVFMGGVDLDLRNAAIDGDEATLEVHTVMGGVKIRVPRNWIVVNRVSTILGGVEDRTSHSNGNQRLVVEGSVLMGGLDIRN